MKKYFLEIILAIIVMILLLLFFILSSMREKKKLIIGTWKAVDSEDNYSYIFNENGTCSYEMSAARLDCVYEKDEEQLAILYDGNTKPNRFQYRFEKDTLIIQDTGGKEYKFIRQK